MGSNLYRAVNIRLKSGGISPLKVFPCRVAALAERVRLLSAARPNARAPEQFCIQTLARDSAHRPRQAASAPSPKAMLAGVAWAFWGRGDQVLSVRLGSGSLPRWAALGAA